MQAQFYVVQYWNVEESRFLVEAITASRTKAAKIAVRLVRRFRRRLMAERRNEPLVSIWMADVFGDDVHQLAANAAALALPSWGHPAHDCYPNWQDVRSPHEPDSLKIVVRAAWDERLATPQKN